MKAETQRLQEEDRIAMDKIREQLRKEEIEGNLFKNARVLKSAKYWVYVEKL